MTQLEKINEEGISVIIGARNEYPQIVMTVCNLMEDMHSSGIEKWEIIIQDNGSTDETSRFFGWKPIEKGYRWKYEPSPRGLIAEDRLRIFYDPVLSNVGTRNKGVLNARYENIIFADAHIIVRPGTIKSIVSTLNDFGGIIHAAVSWMGASSDNPQPGYQYSYKVGEKIWGTWNKAQVAQTPFYIPLCGHCFLAVKKKEFIEKRGYPYAQRVYGGGEPYLDTKWWMTGSTSVCDPNALVYHLSAGRGYSWHNIDLIHNMLLVSYILGGEEWIDRIYITYLNKPGTSHELLTQLYNEAKAEGEEDKKWLDENKIMTFEELLGLNYSRDLPEEKGDWWCERCEKRGRPDPHVMRPWDKLNDELHGTHRSWVQEFELKKIDGKVYIGNTEIKSEQALEVASKYV